MCTHNVYLWRASFDCALAGGSGQEEDDESEAGEEGGERRRDVWVQLKVARKAKEGPQAKEQEHQARGLEKRNKLNVIYIGNDF